MTWMECVHKIGGKEFSRFWFMSLVPNLQASRETERVFSLEKCAVIQLLQENKQNQISARVSNHLSIVQAAYPPCCALGRWRVPHLVKAAAKPKRSIFLPLLSHPTGTSNVGVKDSALQWVTLNHASPSASLRLSNQIHEKITTLYITEWQKMSQPQLWVSCCDITCMKRENSLQRLLPVPTKKRQRTAPRLKTFRDTRKALPQLCCRLQARFNLLQLLLGNKAKQKCCLFAFLHVFF